MTAPAGVATLHLPASLARALREHARAELPNEACGLIAGDAATGTAAAFHAARNEHASPLRFSVDRRDLVRITYAIAAAGHDLVAIFHSHPRSAAEPSATDLREARYPAALHVIAGSGGELRAWQVSEGDRRAVEVRLAVGD